MARLKGGLTWEEKERLERLLDEEVEEGDKSRWIAAIQAQSSPPLWEGVSILIDGPPPPWEGNENTLLMEMRIQEAKECIINGYPLPEWAVEVPLAWPKERTRTSAAQKALKILRKWEPPEDGGIRAYIIMKLEWLMKQREKNPLYHRL